MFGFFEKKNNKVPLRVDPQTIGWRTHMWVMTPDGVGIIFRLGVVSTIHLVDNKGETFAIKDFNMNAIRQAKFEEIPACRRCNPEHAKMLGY